VIASPMNKGCVKRLYQLYHIE